VADNAPNNGRVIAVIGEKIDNLALEFRGYREEAKADRERIRNIELVCAGRQSSIDVLTKDVDVLKKRSFLWDAGNSVFTGVAALIALFKP
jgi:hypothetical protein